MSVQALAAMLYVMAIGDGIDCGFKGGDHWERAVARAVASGEIADPRSRVLPELPPPARPAGARAIGRCLSGAHIFPYEDTRSVLIGDFSDGQLLDLMMDAANSLLAVRGDEYDFIGYWLNFEPDHTIGAAFYLRIQNDVHGIGLVGEGINDEETFDRHEDFGLAGERIEGMVMMWNVDSTFWAPGGGGDAALTRLVLGQEFEHRFALFLPDLLDGRVLQGDNAGCGRVFH